MVCFSNFFLSNTAATFSSTGTQAASVSPQPYVRQKSLLSVFPEKILVAESYRGRVSERLGDIDNKCGYVIDLHLASVLFKLFPQQYCGNIH